ncbi:hypothetical protein F4802DRAFT_511090 [Xylaria palmicola]|nr:hypothetical protein F4802DRAFT_511090 [Xylaria palmicola]
MDIGGRLSLYTIVVLGFFSRGVAHFSAALPSWLSKCVSRGWMTMVLQGGENNVLGMVGSWRSVWEMGRPPRYCCVRIHAARSSDVMTRVY